MINTKYEGVVSSSGCRLFVVAEENFSPFHYYYAYMT
jgi:hypothetical protein